MQSRYNVSSTQRMFERSVQYIYIYVKTNFLVRNLLEQRIFEHVWAVQNFRDRTQEILLNMNFNTQSCLSCTTESENKFIYIYRKRNKFEYRYANVLSERWRSECFRLALCAIIIYFAISRIAVCAKKMDRLFVTRFIICLLIW